jgi:hypothetical protein
LGAFLVESAGKAGKALLPKKKGQGVDTDAVPGFGEFPLNVVDGEVPLPHGDHQVSERVADGSRGRSLRERRKEPGAKVRIVSELMTEDAEGAGSIAEAACDFGRREPLDDIGAEGFVLPLEGRFGGEEEVGVVGCR